jgi:hypothetical protein
MGMKTAIVAATQNAASRCTALRTLVLRSNDTIRTVAELAASAYPRNISSSTRSLPFLAIGMLK